MKHHISYFNILTPRTRLSSVLLLLHRTFNFYHKHMHQRYKQCVKNLYKLILKRYGNLTKESINCDTSGPCPW